MIPVESDVSHLGPTRAFIPTSIPESRDRSASSVPSSVQFSCRIVGVKRIEITILEGVVRQGEDITVAFGKGAGTRMQTFVEESRFFHVERFGPALLAIMVPNSPSIRVLDDTAVSLSVVNPSTVRPGSEIRVLIRAEDKWGTPPQGSPKR